jgi:putative flavoprotein involved in K+ transport
MERPERIHTVIIGAGQAGLAAGYHLSRRNIPFLIVDAHPRIGDSWRNRWDSLRLFTAARYNGLPGMKFPGPMHRFPTKDEMGDYLESYAARFGLAVRTSFKVDRLSRQDGRYVVESGTRRIEAENAIIAMASYQAPRTPAFARELDPSIVQIHSFAYRNPRQLREGGVLIAGGGNSGSEIAIDLARAGHRTWMAGRDTGQLPFRINGFFGRWLFVPLLLRVVFFRILTVDTPMGRKARSRVLGKGGPLIRVLSGDLAAAGVERVAKMTGVRDGRPMLDDGRVLDDVTNVVWCTGFHPGLSWVDLPILDEHGEPRHDRGVAVGEPGLYFVGQHFQYAMSSTMVHGAGRDAERIVKAVEARTVYSSSSSSSTPASSRSYATS